MESDLTQQIASSGNGYRNKKTRRKSLTQFIPKNNVIYNPYQAINDNDSATLQHRHSHNSHHNSRIPYNGHNDGHTNGHNTHSGSYTLVRSNTMNSININTQSFMMPPSTNHKYVYQTHQSHHSGGHIPAGTPAP
eukprot:345986_1